jgi:hypothetical protein
MGKLNRNFMGVAWAPGPYLSRVNTKGSYQEYCFLDNM